MSYTIDTINDEIEHLEADLAYLQNFNTDSNSPAYIEVERRLQEAYTKLKLCEAQ
jgi:hypothetical protein